jgi:hypothetical protein
VLSWMPPLMSTKVARFFAAVVAVVVVVGFFR